MDSDPESMRPFFFICPVWGERFCRVFVDTLLASLLAPGNIPAIINKSGSRFVIATTPEDQIRLEREPLIQAMRQHIEPHFIDITQLTSVVGAEDNAKYGAASRGFLAGANLAYQNKGFGSFLVPDMLLADGAIIRLQQLAAAGKRLVVCPGVRFNQDELIADLRKAGIMNPNEPLAISPRQAVRMALPHLHAEGRRYIWSNPYYTTFSYAAWWDVPGADGFLLHTHAWDILLFDYSAISAHDSTEMLIKTVDGAYAYDNFGNFGPHIHAVTDTDEIAHISLTPRHQQSPVLALNPAREAGLRGMHESTFVDPLHRQLFWLPVFLHATDITPAWNERERQVSAILRRVLKGELPSPMRRLGGDWYAQLRVNVIALADMLSTAPKYHPREAITLKRATQLLLGLIMTAFRPAIVVCSVLWRRFGGISATARTLRAVNQRARGIFHRFSVNWKSNVFARLDLLRSESFRQLPVRRRVKLIGGLIWHGFCLNYVARLARRALR